LTANIHNSSGYAGGAAQISQANAINDKSLPNSSTKLMTSLVPIRPQTSQILHVTPEALPKFHNQMQSMTSLIPIWPQTSAILQVTPEALPKFHRETQLMTSLVPILPQTSNKLSGYAGGAAQNPQANPNNDKSRPNSSTHIHNSSGYAGGAAQISKFFLASLFVANFLTNKNLVAKIWWPKFGGQNFLN